jgi:hypothetical protein
VKRCETRDSTVADDAYDEQYAETAAAGVLAVGKAEADKDRAIDNAKAWQGELDGAAQADDKFYSDELAIQQNFSDTNAGLVQQYSDVQAQIAMDEYIGNSAGLVADAAAATAIGVTMLDLLNGTFHADIGARSARASTKAQVADDYQHNYDLAEATWAKKLDSLDETDELATAAALATQDKDDATARAEDDEARVVKKLKRGRRTGKTEGGGRSKSEKIVGAKVAARVESRVFRGRRAARAPRMRR